MKSIIKLENIDKIYETKFEKIHVLKNINLEIKKNDFISIRGKSGSGKTSFLNILGLLDDKTNGEIYIGDKKLEHLKDDDMAKIRSNTIGFIFQFHHLLNEFTALENVMLPALIGKDKEEVKKKALELLDLVGLKDRIHHKPIELSGGEKQRVAIARALINSPDLLLADEPTGNLDHETSNKIHELFKKINEKYGQSLVIVTHSLDLATIAKEQYELKNGILTKI